jgi:hypothetical protein
MGQYCVTTALIMLEGMHKQIAFQPPCGNRRPPANHPQTSGCARWNSLHLYRVQGQGYAKMAPCYEESTSFSKRQFVPLLDTESGDILRLL